jgi:hypothetical protein
MDPMIKLAIIAAIVIPIIVVLALVTTPAQAKMKPQYAQSPNASWFESQKDCNGGSCCGRADGEPYYDGYEQKPDGSVVLGNGTKIDACQVTRGPNPTGHAIWWRSDARTYCFSPGPGL